MLDRSLPDISLMMVRKHMENLPQYTFPEGYGHRMYRPGDEQNWARIQVSAGEFAQESRALEMFDSEFMKFPEELARRMLFATDNRGNAVGTAAAWVDDLPLHGETSAETGRLHWVAVESAHQGKGLARPMLSAAMNALASLGCKRAYLLTQPPSYVAIRLYLQFGFEPVYTGAEDNMNGWRLVKERINGQ